MKFLETLTYMDFPYAHWSKLRSNNVIERLNREIRRRTRVVGAFPDGKSALMLVCARLRHVTGKAWGTRRYYEHDSLGRNVERRGRFSYQLAAAHQAAIKFAKFS